MVREGISMKERPILFSGAMVRALLDGRKTQTRRILKPQPDMSVLKAEFQDPDLWEFRKRFMMYEDDWSGHEHAMYRKTERGDPDLPVYQHRSPFGEPGDRLWVRETFFAYGRWETRHSAKKGRDEWHFIDMTLECDRAYQYAADAPDVPLADNLGGVLPAWWKRPAIHMPRVASRITPEVTGVRVERLQGISYDDALAEGVSDFAGTFADDDTNAIGETPEQTARRLEWPQRQYRELWDSLNAARGYGWDANPFVWVVSFRRLP
jgi:hypothetical protein